MSITSFVQIPSDGMLMKFMIELVKKDIKFNMFSVTTLLDDDKINTYYTHTQTYTETQCVFEFTNTTIEELLDQINELTLIDTLPDQSVLPDTRICVYRESIDIIVRTGPKKPLYTIPMIYNVCLESGSNDYLNLDILVPLSNECSVKLNIFDNDNNKFASIIKEFETDGIKYISLSELCKLINKITDLCLEKNRPTITRIIPIKNTLGHYDCY